MNSSGSSLESGGQKCAYVHVPHREREVITPHFSKMSVSSKNLVGGFTSEGQKIDSQGNLCL